MTETEYPHSTGIARPAPRPPSHESGLKAHLRVPLPLPRFELSAPQPRLRGLPRDIRPCELRSLLASPLRGKAGDHRFVLVSLDLSAAFNAADAFITKHSFFLSSVKLRSC